MVRCIWDSMRWWVACVSHTPLSIHFLTTSFLLGLTFELRHQNSTMSSQTLEGLSSMHFDFPQWAQKEQSTRASKLNRLTVPTWETPPMDASEHALPHTSILIGNHRNDNISSPMIILWVTTFDLLPPPSNITYNNPSMFQFIVVGEDTLPNNMFQYFENQGPLILKSPSCCFLIPLDGKYSHPS